MMCCECGEVVTGKAHVNCPDCAGILCLVCHDAERHNCKGCC
jgi:hypothetical protein